MSIWKALIVGHLIVNGPVVCIIIAVTFLGALIVPWQLALIGASLLAWIWWAYWVPRWRNWAIRNGSDPDRLQRVALRTGLTWPRGSILEKTEFRPKQ